jgi:F-type H+-transporting ATPase subunit a
MLNYLPLFTSPLDQFEIRDYLSINAPVLANLHLSISNIGLYLTTGFLIALCLIILARNYNKILSNT